MNTFSNIISWVFMPLTMPLIALIVVMYTPTQLDFNTFSNSLFYLDGSVKKFFFNSFTLFGWIFPTVSILLLKMTKQVDSIELDNQQQRFLPLLLTGIYALMLMTLLYKFNNQMALSRHLFSLASSGILVAAIFMTINLKTKISLHAGGVGILLGFLFSYYMEQSLIVVWPLYVSCIVGGCVIASRIQLKKHTDFQLLLGFILGFFITFIVDIIWVRYF